MSMNRLTFSPSTRRNLATSDPDVVITGASGWLGRATLEMLESSLGPAFSMKVHAFASTGRSIRLRSGARLEVQSLRELPNLRVGRHLLAHYAFATREQIVRMGISDYISRNEEIGELVANHVVRSRPVGLLTVSSGAVNFGAELAANPYGALKARDERRFLEFGQSLAGDPPRVVVPRLFNLAGPFLNKTEHYVLGSIIEDIAKGGPIHIRAAHPVIRSYLHVADLTDLAFAMMIGDRPLPLEAFDTAGEREIEVGELATLAALLLGRPDIPIQRPPMDGTAADRYAGNPDVLNDLVQSYGIVRRELPQQIEETAGYLTS